MGRDAHCSCRWGGSEGTVTALLESRELIVRGEIRQRAALSAIERVEVRGENLAFTVCGERVELELGARRARSWADAMCAPPPSLASKFGIVATTRLHVSGANDDDALRVAFAEARDSNAPLAAADLAIVRTDDEGTLERWLRTVESESAAPPVWIVYRKGARAPLGERRVRECMRGARFIDTKVAAVSERLTALRFIRKR